MDYSQFRRSKELENTTEIERLTSQLLVPSLPRRYEPGNAPSDVDPWDPFWRWGVPPAIPPMNEMNMGLGIKDLVGRMVGSKFVPYPEIPFVPESDLPMRKPRIEGEPQ